MTREQLLLEVETRDQEVRQLAASVESVNQAVSKLDRATGPTTAAVGYDKLGVSAKRAAQEASAAAGRMTTSLDGVSKTASAVGKQVQLIGTSANLAANQTTLAAGRMSRAWSSVTMALGKYGGALRMVGAGAGVLGLASGRGGAVGTIASAGLTGLTFGPWGAVAGVAAGAGYELYKYGNENAMKPVGHAAETGEPVYRIDGKLVTRKKNAVGLPSRLPTYEPFTGRLRRINTAKPDLTIQGEATGQMLPGDRPSERGQQLTPKELIGTVGPKTELSIALQRRAARAAGTATDVDDLAVARAAIKEIQAMMKDGNQTKETLVALENQRSGLINEINGILTARADAKAREKAEAKRRFEERERAASELSEGIQLRMIRAEGTPNRVDDDLAAARAALKETEAKIKSGRFTKDNLKRLEQRRSQLRQEIDRILDQQAKDEDDKKKKRKAARKAKEIEELDVLQRGRNVFRDELTAREELQKARAIGDAHMIREATWALEDALLERAKLKKQGIVVSGDTSPAAYAQSTAKQAKQATPEEIRKAGGLVAWRMDAAARQSVAPSYAVPMGGGAGWPSKLRQAGQEQATPVVNVYLDGRLITAVVRKELLKTNGRNTTQTRGRQAGRNAL